MRPLIDNPFSPQAVDLIRLGRLEVAIKAVLWHSIAPEILDVDIFKLPQPILGVDFLPLVVHTSGCKMMSEVWVAPPLA